MRKMMMIMAGAVIIGTCPAQSSELKPLQNGDRGLCVPCLLEYTLHMEDWVPPKNVEFVYSPTLAGDPDTFGCEHTNHSDYQRIVVNDFNGPEKAVLRRTNRAIEFCNFE